MVDLPRGVGHGDVELDELLAARAVVAVLVDDLAGRASRRRFRTPEVF